MSTFELTFAVCFHNPGGRIARVIEAIAQQTLKPGQELLLVDNNSTDGSGRLALEHARRMDTRCRYVIERRQGLSFARRRAVLEAQGEIISFIDDDNVVEPDWAEKSLLFMAAHPQAGIVGGHIYPILTEPSAEAMSLVQRFGTALAIRDPGTVERVLADAEEPPCGAGMTGRRSVLRRALVDIGLHLCGRRGSKLSAGEDTEIGLIARRLGWETWSAPQLRLGHLIPPHRLEEAYMARLEEGFTASRPWLAALEGRYPLPSRGDAIGRAAQSAMMAMKMTALTWVRKNGHADSSNYPRWKRKASLEARAWLRIALDNPMRRLVAAKASDTL